MKLLQSAAKPEPFHCASCVVSPVGNCYLAWRLSIEVFMNDIESLINHHSKLMQSFFYKGNIQASLRHFAAFRAYHAMRTPDKIFQMEREQGVK